MQIYSFSPFGYEGSLVSVEVDLRRGIPSVDMVGLADGAVKESRERMRSAIRNSGFDFPPERVLISLSPADLKKEGAGFDLAIALSVLASKTSVNPAGKELLGFPILVMGELELSGKLRPVKAVHAAASTAASSGIMHCIVPSENAMEAREVKGMKVFAASDLTEAYSALFDADAFSVGISSPENGFLPENCQCIDGVYFPEIRMECSFDRISGQHELIRALQICAAGGHNILAFGPPGCGKTMAMQCFPEILPLLTLEEAQSVTRIYSIAGLLQPSQPLVRIPPFRMPHQTASIEGICGGGNSCRPGEISLAHNGVLFLDEAAEFRSSVLQMLRVPLESASITLSRAGRSTVYPASFQLLMSANPCPCGNYGSENKICLCSARSVEQYWKKFSSPLLDRVDLRVKCTSVDTMAAGDDEPVQKNGLTASLRKGIAAGIKMQRERQGIKNARLRPEQIHEYCIQDYESRIILEKAVSRHDFSPRAVASCLKVARTIADMECSSVIEGRHMEEAVKYRKNSGMDGLL